MPWIIDDIDPNVEHRVDDALYQEFLGECLGITIENPCTVIDYLMALDTESRKSLEQYIVHRLAEVDPGFVP